MLKEVCSLFSCWIEIGTKIKKTQKLIIVEVIFFFLGLCV